LSGEKRRFEGASRIEWLSHMDGVTNEGGRRSFHQGYRFPGGTWPSQWLPSHLGLGHVQDGHPCSLGGRADHDSCVKVVVLDRMCQRMGRSMWLVRWMNQ